ncbi:MAG: MaoC/PaaZ C-terminal domain-containing protein [Solirubrobacteraceae bacterium]
MITLSGIEDVKAHVGQDFGVTDWLEVTQQKIDEFAQVTGDDRWIHVEPERAKATPFGATSAHGLHTRSLSPRFSYDLFTLRASPSRPTTATAGHAFPLRCPARACA